jgi:hypothetical protein
VLDEIRTLLESMGATPIVDGLRAGLTDADIEAQTEELQTPLRGLVRELYKIHDGQDEYHTGSFFPGDIPLSSLESALTLRTQELPQHLEGSEFLANEKEDPESWWPIATLEDYILVASLETERVFWIFETEGYFAANDLVEFFERYRDLLAAGAFVVNSGDGSCALVDPDDSWIYEKIVVSLTAP